MIYRTQYELNNFSKEYVQYFKMQIIKRLAVNDTPDWEDIEQIHAGFFGATRKKTEHNKNSHEAEKERGDAYDVYLDDVAWSVKSLTPKWLKKSGTSLFIEHGKTKGKRRTVELCLARCSTDVHHGVTIARATTDPTEAARLVLDIWNKRVSSAKSKFDEFRVLLVLKSVDGTSYILYEHTEDQIDYLDWNWSWNNRLLCGLHRSGDKICWCADNQLKYNFEIPNDEKLTVFSVDPPPIITDEMIFDNLRQLGYNLKLE